MELNEGGGFDLYNVTELYMQKETLDSTGTVETKGVWVHYDASF